MGGRDTEGETLTGSDLNFLPVSSETGNSPAFLTCTAMEITSGRELATLRLFPLWHWQGIVYRLLHLSAETLGKQFIDLCLHLTLDTLLLRLDLPREAQQGEARISC